MNRWEQYLGVKYPACKMTGQCCRLATPSLPAVELLKKAAEGDSFARDFLCLFEPYNSIEQARSLAPELVERALIQAKKSPKFKSVDQVVFFCCRYLKGKNECMVYEDRPQLCRDYPDTPFLLMHPGCAFENWSKECKQKYKVIKEELKTLQSIQKILSPPKKSASLLTKTLIYTSYIISPGASWLR